MSEPRIWKLEKDLCRCCHAEGKFTNLSKAVMDQQDIYCDMLSRCFDIDISPVPGDLCNATYTICEDCATKVQNANMFKIQVLRCEEKFYDMLQNNLIEAAAPTSIKCEPIESIEEDASLLLSDNEAGNDSETAFDMKMEDSDGEDTAQEQKNQLNKLRRRSTKADGILRNMLTETGTAKVKKKAKPKPKKKTKTKKIPPSEEAVKTEKQKEDWREDKFQIVDEGGLPAYQCVDCGRTFKKRDHFSQHYKFVHLKMRPKLRSCHLCNIKVPTQYRPFHMEQAHGLPAPTCGACGKKFAFPNQVLRHQKIYHMGEKQFTCGVCDMKFASKRMLSNHSIIHTALRPYKCNYCDKSFRWKKNLKTHIYMHLDVRKHVCQICEESFVQQTSLKYHMTKKHAETL